MTPCPRPRIAVPGTVTEVSRKRYVILAEEFSADPHYGKTLRGVMRYRRESVAAILDTTRAGETDDGVPTVGSDCAIGKMTTTCELDLEARRRGLGSVFVPTGQTGIAIAGWGIAVDAVVSDFLAGAAERLVVEGHRRGGDLLFVEGQGSLSHPAYSGVTLGLIHGAAPQVFVLCHRAGATRVEGYPDHPLPSLQELVELHERVALLLRPARVACLALNTGGLDEAQARAAIDAAAEETGLPGGRPVPFGARRA